MKKTKTLLAIILVLVTFLGSISVSAYDSVGEIIDNYDEYGRYVYFDFENYGSSSNHLVYMRNDESTNKDGSICDPFGFVNSSGSAPGTGKIVEEKTDDGKHLNYYYSYTQKGTSNYDTMGSFSLQTADGKNVAVGDAVELSFRLRLSSEQTMAASGRMGLITLRRGSKTRCAVLADIYGNIYARGADSGTTSRCVYTNGDGKTVGGDGTFMDITFKWYDVTNTYSLYINGTPVVEAWPSFTDDFRDSSFVTNTFNDDFGVESRALAGTELRTIELLRVFETTDTYSFDIDDIKIQRYETAQQGAYYYENCFTSNWDALSRRITDKNTYRFSSGVSSSNIKRVTDSETNSSCLYVANGYSWGLADDSYQQFTQGSYVIDFDIKANATHAISTKNPLVAMIDNDLDEDVNYLNMLWVDGAGQLYLENDSRTLIPGYKLDGTKWLHIAIIATKYEQDSGKFGSFGKSVLDKNGKAKSSSNQTYVYSYFINGEFVGTALAQEFYEWKIFSTADGVSTGETSSNKTITVTHTEGVLSLDNLIVVDKNTTANHTIYKNADGTVYYDVEYDTDGTTQLRYSTMTLSTPSAARKDTLAFFPSQSFEGYFDNIKIYEGTMPNEAFEAVNSVDGGILFNVDFGHMGFPTGSTRAYVKSSGAYNQGTFLNSFQTAAHVTHKTADGTKIEVTTSETEGNVENSNYATLNLRDWMDFFVPVAKLIDGNQTTVYSFETTIKKVNTVEPLCFFSSRFENHNQSGSKSSDYLFSIDSLGNLWGGETSFKLCDKDGNQIILKTDDWNTIRVDLSISKNGNEAATVYVSYFYDGNLLYLEDGSPALKLSNSALVSVIRTWYGDPNYRLRFTDKPGDNAVTFDIKSAKISVKALPSYVSADNTNDSINNKVTVFEFNIPNYNNNDAVGRYDVVSLKKQASGVEHILPFISADFLTDNLFIGYASNYYELYDASGIPLTLNSTTTPIAIVYDDINGLARYYVDGKIAYIFVNGEFIPAVDLVVYDYNFVNLKAVSSTGYVIFEGHGTNDNAALKLDDYNINITHINSDDTSKLIGFQENGITNGIRLIAGVDSLYYGKVGFEFETFTNGVSNGVKNLTDNVVFSSVVANDKNLTAKSQGYEYLSAVIITNLPDKIDENSYIMARSYTEIGGIKHYDDLIKINLTNDGYYFDNNGFIYQNNFDGLTSVPSELKCEFGEGATGTATITDDGKLFIENPDNIKYFIYLDQYIGNEYVVQADVTIKEISSSGTPELSIMFGYQDPTHYSYAYFKKDGNGKIQTNINASWSNTTPSTAYNLPNLEIDKTYMLSIVCTDGKNVTFFMDGTPIAEGALDKGYQKGKVGITVRGMDILIDNFVVRTAEDAKGNYLLYNQNFSNLTAVPSEWNRNNAASAETNSFLAEINNEALVLTDTSSDLTVVELNQARDFDRFILEADLTMLSQGDNTDNCFMGLAFGIQNDGNFGMLSVNAPSGAYDIKSKDSTGIWKFFANGSYEKVSIGSTYSFKLVCADGLLTAYINGVKQIDCSVDSELLGNQVGIVFSNSQIKVDNVKLTKTIKHFEIEDIKETSTQIRVASFNIGDFSTGSDSAEGSVSGGAGTEITKAEYRALFEKVGADLWGLQEDSKTFNSTTNETPYDAIYSTVLPNYKRNYTHSYNGKAFLSSYEIYDTEAIYYPAVKTSYAPEGTTDYDHAWFWTGKIKVDNKEISVVTLHFDWKCKERRNQQIKSVIEFAKSQEYCIITGDFNPENCINGVRQYDGDSIDETTKNMYPIDWKKFTDEGFVPANGGKFGVFPTLAENGIPESPYPWDNIWISPNMKFINVEVVFESWMNDQAIVVADIVID